MDLGDLLDVFPLPFGRVVGTMVLVGFLALIPAALVAGSGGHGDGFDAFTFGVIMVAVVTVAGVVAAVTAPWARRRPGDDESGGKR